MASPAKPRDLRLLAPAAAAYAGAWLGFGGAAEHLVIAGAVVLCLLAWRTRSLVCAAISVTLLACFFSGLLHRRAISDSTLARLADQEASVTLTAQVASDPRLRSGRFDDFTVLRVTTRNVEFRGQELTVRTPTLVLGPASWSHIRLGETVKASGRLRPSDSADVAGVLLVRTAPVRLRAPPALFTMADRLRDAIARSTLGGPAPGGALVPGLVVGADQDLPENVIADFRASGLSHLTAVSGTNLTLVVGALVLLGRWAGVRGRWLIGLGLLGVLGFVVLARPEPSVLRAAVMGSIALLSLTAGGAERAVRTLSAAALLILLADPALAHNAGFALSVLATAGIVLLAPGMAAGLETWLPAWVPPGTAEAIAVPTAAQLMCTPIVAAIGGGVSLVAIAANLVVEPLVGPATILGLLAGTALLLIEPVGVALGWGAAAIAWVIAMVAHQAATLPGAALPWGSGAIAVGYLAVGCAVVALGAHRIAARPVIALPAAALLVAVLLVRLPSPGWPPDGWVAVMCDIGQGDAFVLNAGRHAAVVVDTGPDPELVDHCLDRLGTRVVPIVVLTHFHSDHVDGLPGVLSGRRVREIEVSPLAVPADRAAQVQSEAGARQVPVRQPAAGEELTFGTVRLSVLAPAPGQTFPDDDGSGPNDASLVLLAEVAGLRILLTGDIEPEAQQALMRAEPGLRADVLKVPHHGSRNQEPALLTGLGARLALISAGKDNDYGHPSPPTLELLRQAGMTIGRTEGAGDLAVVMRDGRLGLVRL
ncbi:MAG: ComEC/Rec2 family competence protein [Nocardioidaceae bacterium]